MNSNFYTNRLVHKPWGHEYVAYRDRDRLAITFVKINKGQRTSLHCHPKKKTGFIILEGNAKVQVGIYKKNIKKYGSLSILVLRPGLFHSLKAENKYGVMALEFETPYKKNDLIRYQDKYGRENKKYEGKKKSLITMNFLLFDHIGGINTLFFTLFNSGQIIIPYKRDVSEVIKDIQKFKIELLPTTQSSSYHDFVSYNKNQTHHTQPLVQSPS